MEIIFSVIIPFKGSCSLLRRLLDTIPDSPEIEVLVVDNNDEYVAPDLNLNRSNIKMFYLENARGPGHARNFAIERATGRWLLFADADDFYNPGAFDVFRHYMETDAECIYFCANSCNSKTQKAATRGRYVSSLVYGYLKTGRSEKLKSNYYVAWARMIKTSLVKAHNIQFAEIIGGDDVEFSVKTGYLANKIIADESVVYCVTEGDSHITSIRTIEYLKSLYLTHIRINQFLCEHGESKHQTLLVFFFLKSLRYGCKNPFLFYKLAKEQGVSIFAGWKQIPERILNYFYKFVRIK